MPEFEAPLRKGGERTTSTRGAVGEGVIYGLDDHGNVDLGATRNAIGARGGLSIAQDDVHQDEDLIDGDCLVSVAVADTEQFIHDVHVRDWIVLKRQTAMMRFGFRFRGFELRHVRLSEADTVAGQSQLAEQLASMNADIQDVRIEVQRHRRRVPVYVENGWWKLVMLSL